MVKNMNLYGKTDVGDVFSTSFIEWKLSKSGAVFGIIRRHPPEISVLINEALNAPVGEEVHVVGGLASCSPDENWGKSASDPLLSPLENSVEVESKIPIEKRELRVTFHNEEDDTLGGAEVRRKLFVGLCAKICLRSLGENKHRE